MYRIKTANKTLYTDAIRYIRLHTNGCFVSCREDEAEGICAKVHERVDKVDTVLQDTVFSLHDGALFGVEPVCIEVEKDIEITSKLLQEGQVAQETQIILLNNEQAKLTHKQAQHYREVIEQAVQSIDDTVAMTTTTLFPKWGENITYTADERVKFDEVLYRCLASHISQSDWTPDVSPSLWTKVLIPDENIIPKWEQPESTNPYNTGDKVSHNGINWISVIDNNIWEPSVYGWEEIDI